MHVEAFVEERSAEAALAHLLPRILSPDTTFSLHAFQGKPHLLKRLPERLRGYRSWLPDDWRILVLIDEDREDCHRLKGLLESCAREAGLLSKTQAGAGRSFHVLNRIAVEEMEAWFFGDVEALTAAYPRLPATLHQKAPYRDPDAIAGGTWEALERVLQRAGYCPSGMLKVQTAQAVSRHMDPWRNRSRSFRVFREGLLEFDR